MSPPAFAKVMGRAPNIAIPKTMSGSIRIVKKQGWGTRLERYGVTIWRRAWRTRVARMIPLVLFFACLGWYFNRPIPDSSAYPLGDIDQLFELATREWERGCLVHQPQNFFQGPGFYGMGESLFFSDLLLGTLPTYMLLAPMFGPALNFNLLHASLTALNGLMMVGALHQFTARPA